jgi:hypothetical protein
MVAPTTNLVKVLHLSINSLVKINAKLASGAMMVKLVLTKNGQVINTAQIIGM